MSQTAQQSNVRDLNMSSHISHQMIWGAPYSFHISRLLLYYDYWLMWDKDDHKQTLMTSEASPEQVWASHHQISLWHLRLKQRETQSASVRVIHFPSEGDRLQKEAIAEAPEAFSATRDKQSCLSYKPRVARSATNTGFLSSAWV